MQRLLVSKKDLKDFGVPYSFSHIARLEAAGQFPKRIKLGQNRVAWYWDEIKEWVAERAAKRETSEPANDNSF